MNLDYNSIGILGFSRRTGLELLRYLLKYNIDLIVSDSKSEAELEDLLSQINYEEVEAEIEFDFNSKGEKLLNSELIILSPGVPYDLEVLKKARNNGIETISEIEFAYRRSQAEIIAVTGTNGKTTTTELLASMLSDLEGEEVKVAGNIGIPFISIVDQIEKGEKVILELSSFQLEAVKEFRAKIAIYLNYSPDHLDRHHTEENYKSAKKNIFLNQDQNDFALINFDDPYLNNLKDELKAEVFGISSKRNDADLLIKNEKALFKKENVSLIDYSKVKLPGMHNKENIAFAALASYLCGQKIDKIQKAAENYDLQSHRMELIENDKNYLIIDDSKATNPDSALKAIKSIDRNLILIAGGQDRNADFSKLASEIKTRVNFLILVGETSEKIASYFEGTELEFIIVDSMEEAAEIGAEKLNQDNALLLSPACPSWDMFNSYKERGDLFKKTVLKNII